MLADLAAIEAGTEAMERLANRVSRGVQAPISRKELNQITACSNRQAVVHGTLLVKAPKLYDTLAGRGHGRGGHKGSGTAAEATAQPAEAQGVTAKAAKAAGVTKKAPATKTAAKAAGAKAPSTRRRATTT